MAKIYTSTMRYYGDDYKLDITVKKGSLFGPTWDMVMGIKNGTMREQAYTDMYYTMMRELYKTRKEVFEELINREVVVLCCYCRPNTFCHRYILASILAKLGCTYEGEIS